MIIGERKWFVYDPYEMEFEFFASLHDAEECVIGKMEKSKEYAQDDGAWPEEADGLIMGEVLADVSTIPNDDGCEEKELSWRSEE